MLTEHFVAAIAAQTKANTGVTKDAGIFLHEHQPLAAQRHVLKKSASAPNGLAVSSSHIFAAQADKATVHVYSREKWNQEAIVPFPERIRSIALAVHDSVLLLGTESGRVLAWEISSGRLVSTSTSHLQPVTLLAVDPSSNFFLSGSPDAMVHVWSLPAILSFAPDASRSPIHTLATHRGPITSIVCGHSHTAANIAISTSEDKSAIVWDYHNGQAQRTYLLPELPRATVLDPAGRGFYVAYEDGTLQTVNFYDEVQRSTGIDTLRSPGSSHVPVQPSPKARFGAESQKLGAALSISLSWDSQTLVSGHETGKVAVWDTAKGNYTSTPVVLPGPVTNLQFLKPTGLPESDKPHVKIHSIVKPKQDSGVNNGKSLIPTNYSLTYQIVGRSPSTWEEALTHPSFPEDILLASLEEIQTWNPSSKGQVAPAADFLSLEDQGSGGSIEDVSSTTQTEEIKELRKQVASLQRIQKVTFQQLSQLREEKDYLLAQEKKRSHHKTESKSSLINGVGPDLSHDVEMSDASGSDESGTDDGDGTANDASSPEGSGPSI